MNPKFLNEAIRLSDRWQQLTLTRPEYRAITALHLESVRLRNEYQTDEEYAAYLNDRERRLSQILKNDGMC
jgi:hypothetical protein